MMRPLAAALALFGAATALAGDDPLDWLDEHLAFANESGRVRGRISGTLDWENYFFSAPAPALLKADGSHLSAPRLSTFLDAQLGARVYGFAQLRVDRGFDPGDGGLRGRLDEYALRFSTPNGGVRVQVGKFATVVGNWVTRHDSWTNPFISAPLPYENLTGMFDAVAATSLPPLLRWADVGPGPFPPEEYLAALRVPLVWGPSYATGASVSGVVGNWNYAVEVKNASLSSRPSYWTLDAQDFAHPTVSARLGYRPNVAWQFGLSASNGSYLAPSAASTLVAGYGLGDYQQQVLAADVSYAWHHLQMWSEAFLTRFTIPSVGPAETFAYYVEARYRFTTRVAGAFRWGEQFYSFYDLPGGGIIRWGRSTWRVEVAPTFRLTPHLQLRIQYGYQHHPVSIRRNASVVATQITLRF